MQKKQSEKTPKKLEQKADRKPYTTPKLRVHGKLSQITAGSGGGSSHSF